MLSQAQTPLEGRNSTMSHQLFLLLATCCLFGQCVQGFNAGMFVASGKGMQHRHSHSAVAKIPGGTVNVGLRDAAARSVVGLRMQSSDTSTSTAKDVTTEKSFDNTVKALVQRYEDFLDWKSDTNGFEMQDWRVDNRVMKMESQNITKQTAPDRAMEALLRTRERYVKAFMDDGANLTFAQARADDFVADTERSLEIIWKEEKERFVDAEETAEKRSKNLVVLANIFIFTPLVLAFLSTMPVAPIIEMTKYYVSNNCNAIGGIKCNGEGPQGQKLPNIQKMFTPPKKIVRNRPANSVNRAVEAEPTAVDAASSQ